MITKDGLKAGAYYYFLTYEDHALTIPVIETLRFAREVPAIGAGETLYLFDRVGEHQPPQCRLPEDLLETVFEFDGLVAALEANLAAQREGGV